MSKIFILGGTGFLGYYTTKELLKSGYEVKTMSLPPMPTKDLLPDGVECSLGNINELSDEDIIALLSDCDGFIYAAGADERTVPKKPAMKFFYEMNVLPTQRLARLSRLAGVKKFVIFNSYFAEFTERLPEFELRKQGYPNNRLLQEQVAFAEGEGEMTVCSIRLPYIFGTMPGREPLWTMFVEQARGKDLFPAPAGGTAMVTVEQVAEAALGALENGEHRGTYPICALNMSYKDFYTMIVEALGQSETTQVPVLTYDQMKPAYEAIDQEADANGVEHGIHMVVSGKLQSIDLFIDPEETRHVLNIQEHDVVESIKETLERCVK